MCYSCFYYYDEHNPSVLEDFEKGIIIKLEKNLNQCNNCDNKIELIHNQYVCLSCGSSNGYKFFDEKIEIQYYRKLFYNRKYQLEKYIKKYEHHENFDRMKVNEIVNELLVVKPIRKRTFKFDLILSKVFKILNYKIEIINDNKAFNDAYKQIEHLI
jgi:hypothetical protein